MWRTKWRCVLETEQGILFTVAEQLAKNVAVSPVKGAASARCKWMLCPQGPPIPTGQCGTAHLVRAFRQITTTSARILCSSLVSGVSCVLTMRSLEFEGTNGQSVLMV